MPRSDFTGRLPRRLALLALCALSSLSACGGGANDALPQLSAASPASLVGSCAELAAKLASLADTSITASTSVAAGTLTVAGQAVPAHCRVTGAMFQRTSTVDGKSYAIGFEVRLPLAWNGRFFHQVNGGTDGSVGTATGGVGGGGALSNALFKGFAVLSSDAGHNSAQNPSFGIDPQARLDYGYQAVGKVGPMAKSLIKTAYGKAPDRSYLGGCSNGGRHAMVAAARYGEQYDGILAGNPGTVLPRAAVANMAGAQAYAALATNAADISTGFTQAERTMVSNAVLAKCDALDGATDGLVQDTAACQAAFNLVRDVPSCAAARDGSCLSAAQKTAIAGLFSGAKTSNGALIYASFPYDAGLATNGWASWKFVNSVSTARDPGAVGMIWQVPPVDPTGFDGVSFALTSNIDSLMAKIQATNATYTESALSFMSPPHPEHLDTLRGRGAKLMIYHGTSDPIFSSDHSVTAWRAWNQTYGGTAADFARLFLVPGMNHCSGGPATDQFDMLEPLVTWVEQGQAPASVLATARGTGNLGGVNADLPLSWAANRTRPLCAYPQAARYNGSGDINLAGSFSCK